MGLIRRVQAVVRRLQIQWQYTRECRRANHPSGVAVPQPYPAPVASVDELRSYVSTAIPKVVERIEQMASQLHTTHATASRAVGSVAAWVKTQCARVSSVGWVLWNLPLWPLRFVREHLVGAPRVVLEAEDASPTPPLPRPPPDLVRNGPAMKPLGPIHQVVMSAQLPTDEVKQWVATVRENVVQYATTAVGRVVVLGGPGSESEEVRVISAPGEAVVGAEGVVPWPGSEEALLVMLRAWRGEAPLALVMVGTSALVSDVALVAIAAVAAVVVVADIRLPASGRFVDKGGNTLAAWRPHATHTGLTYTRPGEQVHLIGARAPRLWQPGFIEVGGTYAVVERLIVHPVWDVYAIRQPYSRHEFALDSRVGVATYAWDRTIHVQGYNVLVRCGEEYTYCVVDDALGPLAYGAIANDAAARSGAATMVRSLERVLAGDHTARADLLARMRVGGFSSEVVTPDLHLYGAGALAVSTDMVRGSDPVQLARAVAQATRGAQSWSEWLRGLLWQQAVVAARCTRGVLVPVLTVTVTHVQAMPEESYQVHSAAVWKIRPVASTAHQAGLSIATISNTTAAGLNMFALSAAVLKRQLQPRVDPADPDGVADYMAVYIRMYVTSVIREARLLPDAFATLWDVVSVYPVSMQKVIVEARAAYTRYVGADPVTLRVVPPPAQLTAFQKTECGATQARVHFP